MPLVTIVSPDVLSRIGVRRGKPWMSPGAFGDIGGMIDPFWTVVAWDERVQGPIPTDLILDSDLLAITSLTPSRYRAIQIADQAKQNDVQVIAGGRDFIGWSCEENGMEEIHEHFPSVCTTTLSIDLMTQILIDSNKKRLEPYYALPAHSKIEMVLPRRDLIMPKRYFCGNTLRSSEGCKLNCGFCTVGGRGYFTKDPIILEQETKMLRGWFFLDVADSFAGDINYVIEVVLQLYKKTHKSWGTEISVADAMQIINGQTLIWHMAQAGCCLLYFGLESVTRKLVNGKSSRELAEEAILECRRVGIVVVGALILDMFGDRPVAEHETEEDIDAMIRWATEWLDFAQFSLVAALPGCAMRKRALRENRIINLGEENWEHYDGAWPTLVHTLSPAIRRRKWREAYLVFSEPGNVKHRVGRTPNLIRKIAIKHGSKRYRQGIPAF